MDDENLKELTNKQILSGIQDIAKEKWGWTYAYITKDGKIAGIILGVGKIVKKFHTEEKGETLQ